jgi:hypothetical protein
MSAFLLFSLYMGIGGETHTLLDGVALSEGLGRHNRGGSESHRSGGKNLGKHVVGLFVKSSV